MQRESYRSPQRRPTARDHAFCNCETTSRRRLHSTSRPRCTLQPGRRLSGLARRRGAFQNRPNETAQHTPKPRPSRLSPAAPLLSSSRRRRQRDARPAVRVSVRQITLAKKPAGKTNTRAADATPAAPQTTEARAYTPTERPPCAMMETTNAPPVANVRQAASSRLQLVVEHHAIDTTQFEVLHYKCSKP